MNRVVALIVEDPALKEDHTRLVSCRQLLSSHLQSCIEADDAAPLKMVEGMQIQDVITQFLHDTWSAIRVESSKLLLSLSPFISESNRKELITALIVACRSAATWQEVHGSILGLTALTSTCKNDALLTISGLCLDSIGHSSIPIQDAARNCLLSVQMHVEDKSALVRSILETIQPLVNESMHGSGSEQCSTLRLDGLMGCLVDNYQQFPQLPLLMSASGDDAQEDLLLGVMATIKRCMIHPASTVRQKTCQLVVIFLSRSVAAADTEEFGASEEKDGVFRIIMHFLIGLVDEAVDTDLWPQLETALIISEDLAQILIDGKLDILSHPQRRGPNGYFDVLVGHSIMLFQRIRTHAAALLLHRAFEVRRMMIQLLPLLARVHVMLGVGDAAIEGEGATRTQSAAEDGAGLREQVSSADLMARMVLSAEALKQNQLLFEAVAEGSGGASSSGAYHYHWSADVRGRLQEVDRRSVLLSALRIIASGMHPSRSHLLETMVCSCAVIFRDIEGTVDRLEVMLPATLRPAAASLHTGCCDDTAFVSTDFIEWFSLVDCFLYSAGEWDALLGTTIAASEGYSVLRNRLGLLRVTWMMLVAQIQSVSRSSICAPPRSSVKGSSRRATATDCLLVYFSNDSAQHDIALRYLLDSQKDLSSEEEGVDQLRHSVVKRLVHRIVPSLTLLTSHPALRSQDAMTNYKPAAMDFAVTSSSPTKEGTASQGGGAHSTTNQMNYWRGMDKWTCEAMSPLILPLTRSVVLQGGTGPLSLAAVLVEWLIACLMDPLWLDGRSQSVKNMFEALDTLLVSSSSHSCCCLGEERWWRQLTAVHIVRAVATALSLRSTSKPTLDARSFSYLIRAASAALELAMFLKREEALSVRCSEGGGRDASSCSVISGAAEMRRLSEESCSILRDAVAYYRPIYVDLDEGRDCPDEDGEFSDWDDEDSEPGELSSNNRSIHDCSQSSTTTGAPLAAELDRLLAAMTGFEQQSSLPV